MPLTACVWPPKCGAVAVNPHPMKTIAILWLRQLKRYFRSRSRIIGSLGQPALFLISMGFGFGPVFEKAGGGDYLGFLAPGIISMGVLFTAIFGGIELIWDRQFGFLKETLVAPVPRWQIMLGRTLGGATTAVMQGVIILIITLIAGFRPASILMIPFAILAMGLIALLFTAVGTAIACKLSDFQGFQLIMNFLVMPLFFLSGALFPLEGILPAMVIIARIDPLSYGVDLLRGILIHSSHFGIGVDIAVLSVLTIIVLAIGTKLFESMEL